MQARRIFFALVILAVVPTAGQAQTAVQLPTFRFFGASTTVSVPDQGGIYLGGVNSSASGSVSRGVPVLGNFGVPGRAFGNRGVGSTASAGGAMVSAQIHDLDSLDHVLLDQAEREAPRYPGLRFSTGSIAPALPSVEEIHRQQIVSAQSQSQSAEAFFQRGQDAETAGKSNVAKLYYQMAARRASGDLKDRALAQLRQLQSDTSPHVAARSE